MTHNATSGVSGTPPLSKACDIPRQSRQAYQRPAVCGDCPNNDHEWDSLHMPALKRRMIVLKPSRMVWPADIACEHADLAL
jgi:hypothetical protein